MSQKFINIDDAAEKLGVSKDRLNAMREAGDLRAYRDGASWKFRTDEIEQLERDGLPSSDDDVLDIEPIAEGDDAESILLTDDEIDLSSSRPPSTIIGKIDPDLSDSDLELAPASSGAFANLEELEVDLEAESSRILEPGDVAAAQEAAAKAQQEDKTETSDLALDDNYELDILGGSGELVDAGSDAGRTGELTEAADLVKEDKPDSGMLELADDEQDDLVLGDSSEDMQLATSDSGINLAPSDSGISLDDVPLDLAGSAIGSALDLAALSSVSEQSSPIAKEGASDDFLLTPVADDESDEDSSQIVALEELEEVEEESEAPAFEEQPLGSGLDDLGEADLGGVEFESVADPAETGSDDDDLGMAVASPAAAVSTTEQNEYPMYIMAGLGGTALIMALCAVMSLDLLQSIWAWDEPYSINSTLMDGILSMFGG